MSIVPPITVFPLYPDLSIEDRIRNNPCCIIDIDSPTEAYLILAVSTNGLVIQHIKNPSSAVQVAAVKQTIHALYYIKNPTEEAKSEFIKTYSGYDINGFIRLSWPPGM